MVLALIREGRSWEQRWEIESLTRTFLDAFWMLKVSKNVMHSFWVEPKVLLGLHFRWVRFSWHDLRSWFWSNTMWAVTYFLDSLAGALVHTAKKPKIWVSSLCGFNPVWCLGQVVEMFCSIWFVPTLVLMIITAANVWKEIMLLFVGEIRQREEKSSKLELDVDFLCACKIESDCGPKGSRHEGAVMVMWMYTVNRIGGDQWLLKTVVGKADASQPLRSLLPKVLDCQSSRHLHITLFVNEICVMTPIILFLIFLPTFSY